MIKNAPANAGDIRDTGLTPGLGRSPGGENGNPLQYSYLENPMDRRAWQATVTVRQDRRNLVSTHDCDHQRRETTYNPWKMVLAKMELFMFKVFAKVSFQV